MSVTPVTRRTDRRRMVTLVVTTVLLVLFVVIGAFARVPYVALGPGPTVNTLGDLSDKPVVQIVGAPTEQTNGNLNLTTVAVADDLTLFQALGMWVSGGQTLTPRDEVYPPDRSTKQVDQENQQEMTGSQDSATLAALGYLGRTHLTVKVAPNGPAAGALVSGDLVTAVDGALISTPDELRGAVSGKKPGTVVTFGIMRAGAPLNVPVTLGSRPDAPGSGYLGVTPQLVPSDPNLKVTYNVGSIGGPSAGLMLSLAVIDKLGTESLTGGKFIAGTGTITPSGDVGEIGGITHKTAAARSAGASYFLVPANNCAEALSNKPSGLTLVKVNQLSDAMSALEEIRTNHPTPHC